MNSIVPRRIAVLAANGVVLLQIVSAAGSLHADSNAANIRWILVGLTIVSSIGATCGYFSLYLRLDSRLAGAFEIAGTLTVASVIGGWIGFLIP